MQDLEISSQTADPTLNLILDTLKANKQALVFIGTKPGAEKTAEEASKKIKKEDPLLDKLSLDALHALSKPTKQCERLARCLKKGIAFHHAGLTAAQRTLIEENFRKGIIRIICCTPTLAAGVDLPAYRTIIRDLKRYSNGSMDWILVLEYLQMAGRAGRPSFDNEGQSITIAQSHADADIIIKRYLQGEPEEISSKLAVEPVLRTYVLSIIASGVAATEKSLNEFFLKTFWAAQYQDHEMLKSIIAKMARQLEEWEFVKSHREDFASADELDANSRISATLLGRRVSELYIDPATAHYLIEGLKKSYGKPLEIFSAVQLISNTPEMRPLLTVKVREYDDISDFLMKNSDKLLCEEPSMYEEEYEGFLNSIKTAMFFIAWADETEEALLLENFQIRPGEIRGKLETAEWLLFSLQELSRILQYQSLIKDINKARMRLRYGVKEDLLALVRLRNIGRVRARKLMRHGIRDIGGIKKMQLSELASLLGEGIAKDLKKQVGEAKEEKQEVLQKIEKVEEEKEFS